jgi:hypothetical protein
MEWKKNLNTLISKLNMEQRKSDIIWMDLYSIDASVILRKIMNYETFIHSLGGFQWGTWAGQFATWI